MAARGRPRRRRILNVVFDTNAIFNKEFDVLASQAAKDLIGRHSNHGDLGNPDGQSNFVSDLSPHATTPASKRSQAILPVMQQ
jgi:hypothetical protein